MVLVSFALFFATAFSTLAWAQQTAWGQCGGQNWPGPKTCVTGYHCLYFNPWYSQCVPECGATTVYSANAAVTTVVSVIPTTTTLKPFASATYRTETYCASTGANGSCAYSTATTWSGHFDFLRGLTVTTTITKPVPVTSVTSIPVATTTLPCYKRELLE